MICRIIGSGRGIAGMAAYITHDQTSAANRRPSTSDRVAWTACLGIPTEETELMVRVMQGLTADAPVLKTMAGINARGRKLKNPYTHIVLSWPEVAEAPAKQEMLSAVAGALDSLGLDHRHYAVLRRALRHGLPARPCRRQPRRPRDRPGRQPRQGRHAQAQPLGRAIRARPRRHRRARACRTARGADGPPRPRAPLPQERHAAQPGPRDRRAAAPAAGGKADTQNGRRHPPAPRPTSARSGGS